MGEHSWNRRQLLAWGATLGTVAAAGCTGDDPADDTETNPDVDVEYEASLETDDAALSQVDNYDLGLTVDRTLDEDGETTREEVPLEDVEIVDAYQVRALPEIEERQQILEDEEHYNSETLEEHGVLYNDIVDELEHGDQGLTLNTDALIPGQTETGLELQINDDYGTHTEEVSDTAYIDAPQDILEDRLIVDQPELWQTLRDDYIQNQVLQDQWMDQAEEIIEDEDVQEELERGDWERILRRAGFEWAQGTQNLQGVAGTSIYASEQAATLEHIFPEVHAFSLNNIEHNTTLAYVEEEDKIYHVDSVGIPEVTHPPKDHSAVDDYDTALDRNNSDSSKMVFANRGSSMINHQRSDIDPSLRNMWVGEGFRESSQEVLREGRGFSELLDFHKKWGLSAGLSPSFDFTAKGTVEDPEIEVE